MIGLEGISRDIEGLKENLVRLGGNEEGNFFFEGCMKQSYKEIGKELVFVCKGLGGVKVCKMGYGCGLDRERGKVIGYKG